MKARATSIGYRRLDEAEHERGLRVAVAALATGLPQTIAALGARSLLLGGRRGRRPLRRVRPAFPYTDHTHERIELACVIKGRCLIRMGNGCYEAREGDVCFFAPQVEHSDTFVERDCSYRLLWFVIERENVGAHVTEYSRRAGFNIVLATGYETTVAAPHLTRDILRAVADAEAGGSLVRFKAILLDLDSIVLGRLLREDAAPPPDWRGKVVDEALEYLGSHYLDNPSLAEISNHVRLSPNYLCALFRKHTGRTIFSHINSLRMGKAEELLVHSNRSMKEIARETGFGSAHYFSRTFRRAHGVSPIQFRRAHL